MTSDDRALPENVRRFLEPPRFATIATIDADGTPWPSVVWYLLEGDTIVINSRVGRRWPTNLVRDPRLGLSVIDVDDGYRWIGIVGRVEVVDDPAQALADISAMAGRYHAGEPERAERMIERTFRPQRRISFRLHVEGVQDHLEDD